MSIARRQAPHCLDAFVRGYVDAAIEHLGDRGRVRRINDIDPDAMEELVNRAARFYDSKWHVIEEALRKYREYESQRTADDTPIGTRNVKVNWELAGHDFYFTSNDLTDYFDRTEWLSPQRKILTDASHAFGDKYGHYSLSVASDGTVVGKRT